MNQTSKLSVIKAIALFSILFLISCNNAKKAPPFPVHENEYLQPESRSFTFSEPDTLTWVVQDPAKIKPLPTTKFNLDKLPSKPFDIGIPYELKKPLEEKPFNWDSLPTMPFSLDSLPKEELTIKVTILGEPKIVKAGFTENSPGASRGVMTLGTNFGLPSAVLAHMIDSDGMIWFGTSNAIVRYDGYNLEIYGIEQGLDMQFIQRIYEDSKGRIWVFGGQGGRVFIDKEAHLIYELSSEFKFEDTSEITETHDGKFWLENRGAGYDIIDLEENSIRQFRPEHGLLGKFRGPVFQAEDGLIWMGSNEGINIIDQKAGKNIKMVKGTIPGSDRIFDFYEDKDGDLWMQGRSGVFIMNASKATVTSFSSENGLELKDEWVSDVFQDSSGKFWIVSQTSGMYFFDKDQGLLENFKLNNVGTRQWFTSIFEDKQGDIWVNRAQGGDYKIDRNNGRIGNFDASDGLGDNNVWSILEASDGSIWIGTYGGIDIYDPVSKTLKHLGEEHGLVHDRVIDLMQDSKGRIWAAGNIIGISILDPEEETIRHLTPKEGLQAERIRSMIEDDNGTVWIGSNGNGIVTVDLDKAIYKKLLEKDSVENESRINRVIRGKKGQVWIASHEYGVSVINTKDNSRRRLSTNNGLVSDAVYSVAKDNNEDIWAATDKGVQYIDIENQNISTFTILEGLGANDVYDIISSHKDEIFLGTSKGLAILKPEYGPSNGDILWKSKTLTKNQGLDYIDFAQNSFTFDSKGRFWTAAGGGAGIEALVVMDDIKNDSVTYPTYITSLNILDKPQVFMDRQKIEGMTSTIDTLWARGKNTFYMVNKAAKDSSYLSLNDIQWESIQGPYDMPVGLTLPHTQNYLSFNYNGAQFDNPDKVVYRYILEGIDKNWSPISNKTTSENYRDLAPGEYTFKVASKGFNGVWSKPAELQFTITPPWWQTWWAYTIFVILFLGLGLVILHYRSKWLKKENRILEERVTERTAELKKTIHELENTQSQLIQSEKMASLGELTAGIAHEIQNPMNFINNFAEVSNELMGEMCEELDKGDIEEAKDISKDIVQNLEKISHHGKRASSIVRGMLEHSRNSSGQRELIDINVLADEYLRLAYHGLRAKDKSFNSDFKTDFDETLPKVSIIPQDLGRVVLNLINNAFYAVTSIPEQEREENYSPCVTVHTKNLKDQVLISIKDNGPGIPAEIKDKIFQPFFTTKPTGKGTGLGLSLAYDIVTTGHGGAIELESSPGKGTEFLIYIPFIKGE